MDPCTPHNLSASVNCDMRIVSLSWDGRNGTNVYMVSAEAANRTTSLTTNGTTAHFSDLSCGQNYSLIVAPHSQYCPGTTGTPASIQTWPCPPVRISTRQDCLSALVEVAWEASNGSDFYTATIQTGDGISNVCMSDSNQCSVPGLICGRNFSVTVTASNQQCKINSSESTSLQSVPCAPTNISTVTNGTTNTALVSWSPSLGAVRYTVTAQSNLNNVSCQTSEVTCNLDTLTCGNSYSVQVVAMDDNCSSIPSQAQMVTTAPCPPQNVSVNVSCPSNDISISWNTTGAADHFLVSVIPDNGGASESCNTTNTACSIRNVTCGHTFSVHVTSVRGSSHSQHSQTISIQSAPCQPPGITGRLDCVTNSAWISWDAAAGADSYFVTAVGAEGSRANCSTSSNTTCEVEDLACGVLYNFSVVAKNSNCESQSSETITLETAPCSLSGVTAVSQCHNSTILVLWDVMEGGEGNTVYSATAEARDRTYLSCNITGTSCYLYGAQCDSRYSIIVSALSDQCSNLRSPPYRISMEPCPPTNVAAHTSCEEDSALVSWSPSPVAETYHVVAVGEDGHNRTCNSTSTNCTLSQLLCEQKYTVFVTASHENCTSQASNNLTITTGPCQPNGLSVEYHCHNQSVLLSWTRRENAVVYYGYAQNGNGSKLLCQSTSTTCTIHGLDCGAAYNFSVQASDGVCNSSFSQPLLKTTIPCPPDTVELQLLPMQMEIQVLRFEWMEVNCNNTQYLLKLTGSLLGDSQAQFDLSSYWTSTTYYEIPLPCGSSYTATVESRNAAGTSDPSVALTGNTAPCPPTEVVFSGNSTSATVSWNTSVFATTYTVYDNSVTPRQQLCSTASFSCSLFNVASTNLVMTASNAAGESEATNVTIAARLQRKRRDLTKQTLHNEAHSTLTVNVTRVTSTFIYLEWFPADEDATYTVIIKKQDGPMAETEPRKLTVIGSKIFVMDLSPKSAYCLSVSTGVEPESELVCVQTASESHSH
ncbi:fibronectin type III domain-containing protein 7-like [Takifugu rubripes]|uniref:fibronectin type III domain-containing protein 7-like n=1 Tax=Takifugu rubripes TaxID=31033 RepID=UPI001145CB6A|nr:fibronectin type III domain-containing protein 7-like [Takifugu rubripes]